MLPKAKTIKSSTLYILKSESTKWIVYKNLVLILFYDTGAFITIGEIITTTHGEGDDQNGHLC